MDEKWTILKQKTPKTFTHESHYINITLTTILVEAIFASQQLKVNLILPQQTVATLAGARLGLQVTT